MKYFLLILFFVVSIDGFTQSNNKHIDDSDIVFTVVQVPASFPGGRDGWINYLQQNLNADIPVLNGAKPGIYSVVITFIVDKMGKVKNVQAENDPGYGTMQEAIRVIKNGPDWVPAMQNGTKVNCRHRQSISFRVENDRKIITKYYDSIWANTTKERAKFSITYEDKDSVYDCTAYYLSSNKMYSKYIAIDTFPSSFINLKLGYYESGRVKDSCFNTLYKNDNKILTRSVFEYEFYENRKIKEGVIYGKKWGDFDKWVYYENGKPWAHIYRNEKNPRIINEAFDLKGEIMPNYIYEQYAEFPGGVNGWIRYLEGHLNADIPVQNGARPGKYTVVVAFIVEKDGRVSNVVAENNPGYGTMEEAVRIIKNGPDWEPAIEKNEKVVCRHRQSITFAVEESNK